MGKIKNAAKAFGSAIDAYTDHTQKVDQMANELMKRSYGMTIEEARKTAKVLVTHATVTWK